MSVCRYCVYDHGVVCAAEACSECDFFKSKTSEFPAFIDSKEFFGWDVARIEAVKDGTGANVKISSDSTSIQFPAEALEGLYNGNKT